MSSSKWIEGRFQRRLRVGRPLLLDGGLATRLEEMGEALHPRLWSAALLHSAPERIRQVHREYVAAGAEVLITASYQASREGFASLGLDRSASDRLLALSVSLAREAADRTPALVAASVGPWGATRNDGSEYTGVYAIDHAGLVDFHRPRLEVLDATGADVLACETLPSLTEAEVLATLLREVRTPAWVSFCCRDERHLSDGSPVASAAALFVDHPRVVALGVNCTAPRHLPGLLHHLRRAAPGLPLLVYPNSGERYDAGQQRWLDLAEPPDTTAEARRWLLAGARGVGGCCRMGPDHIRAMARAIEETSTS